RELRAPPHAAHDQHLHAGRRGRTRGRHPLGRPRPLRGLLRRRAGGHHARGRGPAARRGHRHLRQGRAVRAGRGRAPDGAHRRPHRGRHAGVSGDLDLRELTHDLVARALAAGARAADAMAAEGDGLAVSVRLGEVEKLTRSRQRRAGLRVFVGDATAIVSTADFSPDGLAALARDAVALAHATAPDPHAGLPDPAELAGEQPDLDLHDPAIERLEPEQALAWARDAEAAALAAAPEITNSEGAEFGADAGLVAYASSLGFVGAYAGSSASLAVVPV